MRKCYAKNGWLFLIRSKGLRQSEVVIKKRSFEPSDAGCFRGVLSSGRLPVPAADGLWRFDRTGSRDPTDSQSQHVGRPAVPSALGVLDLVERYHATADALDECGRLLCTLQIQRYWGDYGL